MLRYEQETPVIVVAVVVVVVVVVAIARGCIVFARLDTITEQSASCSYLYL